MDREVGFGIVGCGNIGPTHAAGVMAAPGARLVAVCDLVADKAGAMAEKHGNPRVYTDYAQMLADDEVEAVCVCTPSGLHGDMAIAAARAGKHVLTEKPMEITREKIDAMIAAGREAKVKLAVIFQRRTSPLWRKVHEAVACGQLGRMVLGDAYLKYWRDQAYYDSGEWRGTWALDGGGCLMNQGVHCVDLLQWIMGPVQSVFAYADHLRWRIEVEDTAVIVLRFASGAFGVIEGATSVTPGLAHRLEFHGEKGTIMIDGERVVRWTVDGQDLSAEELAGGGPSAAADPLAISGSGHAAQIADLVRAIREDRKPYVSGDDGRAAVELILAIYESARTGREVRLT